MSTDICGVCGGDGRIDQASGQTSRCPGCLGTGRRKEDDSLFRDVTKTKPSHYRQANTEKSPEKPTWPSTFEGDKLAKEVQASGCPDETKARLVREIIEYEGSHGSCTKTFTRKLRKQLR
jgi:hypothetical protein